MKLKLYLFLLFATLFSVIGYSQITVDDSLTTQELVEEYLFNSSCVDLSNFSQITGTDFGDDNGIGAFDSNGSDFPFNGIAAIFRGDFSVIQEPDPLFMEMILNYK